MVICPKKWIYYNDLFWLAASQVELNDIWAKEQYQSTMHHYSNWTQIWTPEPCVKPSSPPQPKFKFNSKPKPNTKPPIQSQTRTCLQALRVLCIIAANSFPQKTRCILPLLSCNPKPQLKPNHSFLTPSFHLQLLFYILQICDCSPVLLWLPILSICLYCGSMCMLGKSVGIFCQYCDQKQK